MVGNTGNLRFGRPFVDVELTICGWRYHGACDGEGGMINSETPPPNTSYWPCPRGAFITLDNGGGDPPTEFAFTGGVVDGPWHCNGKYAVTNNNPGAMVLDAAAGTNSAQDNAFDVKIDVNGDTATVTGTAMTHKNWGTPSGKQTLNGTSKVTQTTDDAGGTTYSITVDAKDKKGNKVDLTITWRPYFPC